jgi:hypothetical protein
MFTTSDLRHLFAARRLGLAALCVLVSPVAAYAEPPANDDYLAAVALNAPGTALSRDAVTSPPVATGEATVQGDLLAPPSVGGPPEPAVCDADHTAYGKTVWWRFHPDVDGRIEVQAVGFDTTLALIPFAGLASPSPQGYACAGKRDDTIETMSQAVEAGSSYAVQVGGTADAAGTIASGTLQVTFKFLPDRDGDGVLDDDDECPTTPGTVNGCPPQIIARVTYDFVERPGGVKLRRLQLRGAPSGARLDVRCSRGCAHRRLYVRAPVTAVRELAGRFFAPGMRIELRVTKTGYVGDYIRLQVEGDHVSSTHRCLRPGSDVPRRSCH